MPLQCAFRSNPVFVQNMIDFMDWVSLIQQVQLLDVRISDQGVYLCGEGELPRGRALTPEEQAQHPQASTLTEAGLGFDFLREFSRHLVPGELLTVQGGGYQLESTGVLAVHGWTTTLNAQGETLHEFDLSEYQAFLPEGEEPRTPPYPVENRRA